MQRIVPKLFYSVLLLFVFSSVSAQKFYAQGGKINDHSGVFKIDSFKIEVKNLPKSINSKFGLSKVCFNINHTRVSDLKIELLAPDGTKIWMSNRNGGDTGSQYMNTCFRSNGFSGYIHEGHAPFEGEFIPDGRIEFVNNNQNPNGNWYLLIQDLKKEVVGNLNYVIIEFNENPTPNMTLSPCTFEQPENCKCNNQKADVCELLPDLVLLEKFTKTQIHEYSYNDKNYPGMLLFAATIANIGDGPMETWGKKEWVCGDKIVDSMSVCSDGSFARQRVYQRIYKKYNNKLQYEDVPAGTNYYDHKPGHDHYHVDDWVEFRLFDKVKDSEGREQKKMIASSRKVSYCLWDTGICNNSDSLCMVNNKVFGERNLPNYGFGNYTDCNSLKQGISVGGYDTYGYMYEGQYLQLPKNLKKGIYYLEIEVDPLHIYKEKDKKNNILTFPIKLEKQQAR